MEYLVSRDLPVLLALARQATVTACIICVVCVVAGTYVMRWYMTQPENVAKFTVSIGPISINTGLVITPILNTVVILVSSDDKE